MPRIERALPSPFGPVSVQHHIAMWKARQQTIRRLRHEEIDETELDRVRAVYRPMWADYQARRPSMATIGDGEFVGWLRSLSAAAFVCQFGQRLEILRLIDVREKSQQRMATARHP